MKKIIGYHIIIAETPDALAHEVRKFLAEGWQPWQRTMQVAVDLVDEYQWSQTMVRYED